MTRITTTPETRKPRLVGSPVALALQHVDSAAARLVRSTHDVATVRPAIDAADAAVELWLAGTADDASTVATLERIVSEIGGAR